MSITKLSAVILSVLAAAMMAMGLIGAKLVTESSLVSQRWQTYELESATKADALSELRGLIGLGGVIDHFHEYQLLGDEPHRQALLESLRLTRANLDAYRTVGPTSPAEDSALDNIASDMNRLEATLPRIAAQHAAKLSPLEILRGNHADLSASAAALNLMNLELSRSSALLTQANIDGLDMLRTVVLTGGGIGSAFMLAAMLLVLWAFRWRVVLPLKGLVSNSRRLAALDLAEPYPVPARQDELGQLGRTLDGAREKLSALLHENDQHARRLLHQATHDPLTELPNRALLLEWLGQKLRRPKSASLALLFLDLDGFKMINDSLGHGVGDSLLKAIALRLSDDRGEFELVSRLGGDEFVLAMDGADLPQAQARAEIIAERFRHPFAIGSMELTIATSIGIALEDEQTFEPEDLLRDADIALYRAKENGRGRSEVFDVALREAVQIRHRLQRDLERAMQDGELFTVYQPIVQLDSGRISGFEALIRWRHPDLGLVSPVQFIPIAEETGAILPLGRMVLDHAARDLTRFRCLCDNNAELTVNVNFSPRQMWDEGHVDEILACLTVNHGIKIEVTESMAMSNPDAARAILQRFRQLGVELCMDDFGTGYSSLSYLGNFPFNVLKMDKSFITGMCSSPTEGQGPLVRGVINLAHDLGLKVVAEGIETLDEMDHLRRLGCDMGQGFHIAKPMTVDDACVFLAQGRD